MPELTMENILAAYVAALVLFAIGEFLLFDYKKRKADLSEYRMIVIGSAVLVSLGAIARPLTFGAWAMVGSHYASLELVGLKDWYLWPVALIIYEFFYWIQHWLGHKVRLLWCIHAPHHAPNSINMVVGFNHSFIEGLFYMPFFLGFFPAFFGVDPILVFSISVLDGVWGSLLHVSDNMVKTRYGVLEKILQTPSYHRAHHAKNIDYMDTNYNSITLFWDTVFGTKAVLSDNNPPIYGITSEVDTGSYLDTHFGEFRKLWFDVQAVPGLVAKLGYIFMPPGWSHTGQHNTVSMQKRRAKKDFHASY